MSAVVRCCAKRGLLTKALRHAVDDVARPISSIILGVEAVDSRLDRNSVLEE